MHTYTRQSTLPDGDVITADDTNNEFDQLLAAFAASSGHTHDGTTAEGGPVTKLLGNTLTFGAATAGTDITITFDGETNDGVFKWMEDEDYFEFSDDILIASTEKIQFRDTAIYINSSADGQLDLVADTEIQIAATTVDINGAVEISGTTAQVGVLTTTATQVATGGITSGSNIVSDTDSTDDLGTTSVRWANLYVDAITATDQITATGFTGTLDGILGSGSAAAATVTTLDTSGAVNLNLVTDSTSSTSGALIVDGGVGIAKKLYVGTDLDVDGTTNLDVVDIDGAVDMASTLAVAGVLTGASLDISGDIDIDGTANLDIVDIDGAVNIAADTTIASTNKIIFNDASQFIHAPSATVLDLAATDEIELTATLVDVVGNFTNSGTIVSAGKITADAGIDIDNFNIDGTTIALSSGNLDIDVAGNVTIDADGGTVTFADGGASLGTITSSGYSGTAAVATTVTITDNESTNENNAIVFTSGGDLDGGNIGLESDGDLKYNPSTGTLSATNISVSGTFSTVDSVTMSANNAVIFEGATADAHETTLTVVDATADRTITLPNVSGTVPVLAAASNTQVTSTPEELNLLDGITAGTVSASLAVIADSNKDITGFRNVTLTGELDAGSLDVSGDIDVDGTTNLDVVDIDGAVDFASTTAHAGNATFADNAKAIFGAGSDLQIYHDGSNSYIAEGGDGTGSLRLQANNLLAYNNSDEPYFQGVTNGTFRIYYDGSTKLATTATGIDVTGNVIASGTVEPAGDTAAGDNAAIGYTAAEGLILTGQGSTSDITLKNDADAVVFTVPTGTDDILFPDNAKALFGAGSDLEIYHDASNSYVKDSGTGSLQLLGSSYVVIGSASGAGEMISAQSGAEVNLKFNNSNKLVTTATGIDVTGDVTLSGELNLTASSNNYIDFTDALHIRASGSSPAYEDSIHCVKDAGVSVMYNGSTKIATSATGVTVTGTAVATTNTDTSNTGSVTLDFAANQNFVLTLTGNVTLANPSTEQVGQSGFITLIQDGTGGRTLSLGTDYETAGGAGITLTSTASATDIIPYVVAAAGRILLGAPQLAFS